MKLLLFDIDGTLISTGGAGVRALNRACLQVLALDNVMDGILPHGKTDPAIIREIFAAFRQVHSLPRIEEMLSAYLVFLRAEVELSSTYRVLPGISAFLDQFGADPDLLLGLATGNIEAGARIKLERGDLNRYFSFGGFGSDSESRTELVRRAAEEQPSNRERRLRPRTFLLSATLHSTSRLVKRPASAR